MNEKIKQLKEQATKIVETTDHCSGASESHAEVDLEKFAELIVRECMEQVWYTREDSINGNVSEVIKQRIEQHFGVEE
jgi:hypothetical protein